MIFYICSVESAIFQTFLIFRGSVISSHCVHRLCLVQKGTTQQSKEKRNWQKTVNNCPFPQTTKKRSHREMDLLPQLLDGPKSMNKSMYSNSVQHTYCTTSTEKHTYNNFKFYHLRNDIANL